MATTIPSNGARFTRAEVLSATAGTPTGPDWDEAEGVVTDSRQVVPGNLFVALRGERFDAGTFVGSAAEAGAKAVLVEHETEVPEGVSAVRVDDPLRALGELASAHRASFEGTVIGITGSAGKTTTKELLAAALEANEKRVLKTAGNLNNLIGVPMTLFQLASQYDVAVVEMGTSFPGEIPRLAEIAKLDAGIVTLAAAAHTEGLGTVNAVADEKMSLVQSLDADGIAVTYGDDQRLRKRAAMLAARKSLYYGRAAENDIRVLDWDIDGDRTRASMQVRGEAVDVRLRLLGEGAVLNAAGAMAMVYGLGLSTTAAAAGMINVTPTEGRLLPRVGRGDRFLIDDTYNANPASVEVALSTARVIAERRQAPLVVVLGDMKELGELSEKAHQEVGALVADTGAFLFIGCGAEMHAAVDAANAKGMDTLWFEDSEGCAELSDRLPLNAVVLVKGSRSMKMERVLAPLLEEAT